MQIQFMSDLHDRYPQVKPKADILALLGDIGDPASSAYRHFIAEMSAIFRHVIVIMGNHEVYGKTKEMAETMISEACDTPKKNVYFLNRSNVIIDGINFAGCTLWSDINEDTVSRINCFKKIYESDETKLTRETYLRWHAADKKFLIENRDIPNTVFLTHYAPMMICNGIFYNNPSCTGFATDLPELFTPNIRVHLFGHTHVNGTWYVNGVRLISNCKGYFYGESRGPAFDSEKTCLVIPLDI